MTTEEFVRSKFIVVAGHVPRKETVQAIARELDEWLKQWVGKGGRP